MDRFGQKSATVRSVLIYGENNPVDGAVLNVILRKARRHRKKPGVRVPLPDDNGSLTKALMSAVMLRAQKDKQMTLDLDFGESEEARQIEMAWLNASENEKRSRTIFAQNALKPEEVAKEWDATQSALGGYDDTETIRRPRDEAAERGARPAFAGWIPGARPSDARDFPRTLRRGKPDRRRDRQADPDRIFRAAAHGLHRRAPRPPFAGVLAETFLEQALDQFAPDDDLAALPRTGAWECAGVEEVTWLAILRIRHSFMHEASSDPVQHGGRGGGNRFLRVQPDHAQRTVTMPSLCSIETVAAWPRQFASRKSKRGLAALRRWRRR